MTWREFVESWPEFSRWPDVLGEVGKKVSLGRAESSSHLVPDPVVCPPASFEVQELHFLKKREFLLNTSCEVVGNVWQVPICLYFLWAQVDMSHPYTYELSGSQFVQRYRDRWYLNSSTYVCIEYNHVCWQSTLHKPTSSLRFNSKCLYSSLNPG